MANVGTPEQDAQQAVEYLWPCNVPTWAHWQAVQTQWRTGMSGATGLDYTGVSAYLNEAGLKNKSRKQTFEGIQAAEQGTLKAWSEKAKKADQNKQG